MTKFWIGTTVGLLLALVLVLGGPMGSWLDESSDPETDLARNAIPGMAAHQQGRMARRRARDRIRFERNALVEARLEDWHEIGAAGEPPFENDWVNRDSEPSSTVAAYYKDASGFIHLKGEVYHPPVAPQVSVVFTLPAGYRPAANWTFSAADPNWGGTPNPATFEVLIDGSVELSTSSVPTGSLTTWLDGISFRQ